MNVEGEITVDAPRSAVFEEMRTPETLARTIPNCQAVEEVGDGRYEATIEEHISQVSLTMETVIEITELRDPEYVEVSIEGQALGGNTSAEGTGTFELVEADGGERTTVRYAMEINVGGKLASLGFKMLKHVVTSRVDDMAENIRAVFEDEAETEPSA